MADYQYALFQIGEIFLEPLHGVEVEVVGRLVEQQVVGMSEECLSQHDAHLLVV